MNNQKYAKILTKQFLKKEYIQNKKSILQLKKELKIDWYTIKTYLKLYGVPLRSHKEQASISSPGGKYIHENVLTKEYLIKEYIKNKKAIVNISRELKIDRTVIGRYLKKYKIPTRTFKEQINISYPSKEFQVNEETKSFIDGLLLGDASLPERRNGIPARSLTQACKYKEYLDYILKNFSEIRILCSPILSRWIKDERCKNKGYNQHFLQTRRYKTFELFRQRWYKKGKKMIPRDLIITPSLLLQSYLCDGNFYREIRLCLDAFTKKDILFLKKSIEKKLNITTRIFKIGKGYELAIKKSDTNKFLNYIGESPVQCYSYKWKDNESEEIKERKRLKARLNYHKSKENGT